MSFQAWCRSAVTLGGTVCGKELRRREALLLLCFLGTAVSSVSLLFLFNVFGFEGIVFDPMQAFGCGLILAACLAAISYIFLGYRITPTTIHIALSTICLGLIFVDLAARTKYQETWPALIVVLDCALVLGAGRRFSSSLCGVCIAWVTLCAVEGYLRFGLFDSLPGTLTQEQRRRDVMAMADCTTLPCSMAFAAPRGLVALAVLGVDFITTRSFATRVMAEQSAMERTIDTMQDIATRLSDYDVDTVEELLDSTEGELPPAMHTALRCLVANLRAYQPYLPALFELQGRQDMPFPGDSLGSVAPPGECGTATIVFTDVRASTSIWEAAPVAMRKAIAMHNLVIRRLIHAYGGYEVKTIGDSCMVAFDSAVSGVDFGLAVHEKLLSAEWPHALLDVPICSRDELWGGLTARVGVNTGPVTAEANMLTGRTDYFGHTVNIAARLETLCLPGAVAVTSDAWASVCREVQPAAEGRGVLAYLKGMTEPVEVSFVWPAGLAERQACPLSSKVSASSHCITLMHDPKIAAHQPPPLQSTYATMGAVQLYTGSGGSAAAVLNAGLVSLTPLLECSGGTLVALLGNCVCAGWNLTRPSQAHAESSMHFVHLLRQTLGRGLEAVGLASGTVQHGDVGSTNQRFLTVVGDAVRKSWTLCDLSFRQQKTCLYTDVCTPNDLPAALRAQLQPLLECDDIVYEVLEHDTCDDGSVSSVPVHPLSP